MKFIFSISVLIISAVLFFTLVNPLYGDVRQLRTEVATYNVALDHAGDLQKTQDGLAANYSNIKAADRERLERFLPNTANNIKFILEIERIANLHNMPIQDIKFTPPVSTDLTKPTGTAIASNDPKASMPYGIFPVEFTTQGNYANFVLFMRDIEHNLRLVDIRSIAFTVPPTDIKQGDPTVYTYGMKIETYWLK